MPSYRIVKPYNSKTKVGDVIVMDSLHPSLASHVVLAGGDSSALRPVAKVSDEDDADPRIKAQEKASKALTPAKLEKLHEDALKIDATLFPKDE